MRSQPPFVPRVLCVSFSIARPDSTTRDEAEATKLESELRSW